MPNFSDIVDAYKKLPTSLFVSIAFILVAILFSPQPWIDKLGLSGFRTNYGVWLGPTLLLCLAILVSRIFTFVSESIVGLKIRRERLDNLKTLSSDEKEYLKEFVDNDTASISREISDGIICSLESKRIVYRSSNVSSYFKTFPYSLKPWARKILKKHPEFLS